MTLQEAIRRRITGAEEGPSPSPSLLLPWIRQVRQKRVEVMKKADVGGLWASVQDRSEVGGKLSGTT